MHLLVIICRRVCALADWSLKAEYRKGGAAKAPSAKQQRAAAAAAAEPAPADEEELQEAADAALAADADADPEQPAAEGAATAPAPAGPVKKPTRPRHAWEFYAEDLLRQVRALASSALAPAVWG